MGRIGRMAAGIQAIGPKKGTDPAGQCKEPLNDPRALLREGPGPEPIDGRTLAPGGNPDQARNKALARRAES